MKTVTAVTFFLSFLLATPASADCESFGDDPTLQDACRAYEKAEEILATDLREAEKVIQESGRIVRELLERHKQEQETTEKND